MGYLCSACCVLVEQVLATLSTEDPKEQASPQSPSPRTRAPHRLDHPGRGTDLVPNPGGSAGPVPSGAVVVRGGGGAAGAHADLKLELDVVGRVNPACDSRDVVVRAPSGEFCRVSCAASVWALVAGVCATLGADARRVRSVVVRSFIGGGATVRVAAGDSALTTLGGLGVGGGVLVAASLRVVVEVLGGMQATGGGEVKMEEDDTMGDGMENVDATGEGVQQVRFLNES